MSDFSFGGSDIRYVMFSSGGSASRPGVVSGDAVRALPDAYPDLAAFVAAAESEKRAAFGRLAPAEPLSGVVLHAPLRPAKNVFCVGRNYMAHVAEGAAVFGNEVKMPKLPTFFTKAPTAIADPGSVLHLPNVSENFDFEAELAVVIGTRCRDVSEADALGVIFGYTCLNDVTARDLQTAHGQWFKGKSLDDTCPIGPWVVPAHIVGDPQALDIGFRLNGIVKQKSTTASMIFSVTRIIYELSRGMTLEPGDVIATGTPEGVGFARNPPEWLHDGDVMEVEIEKIGVLRNSVSHPAMVGAAR